MMCDVNIVAVIADTVVVPPPYPPPSADGPRA
jgi:hypothetical protein